MSAGLPIEVLESLRVRGLIDHDEVPSAEALTGGVASDIWRVDATSGPFCVKRALAKLRVAADWRAPVARNAYEVAWFEVAGAAVSDAVPKILAHDPDAGLFAMEWLDPDRYRLWKADLAAGVADPAVAWAVGDRLGRIHSATAAAPDLAERFATDEIFHAIRLEPYLDAAARAHLGVAAELRALIARTASTKVALVHGDVSPKNIQVGPRGPVFLDAECAWWGDPAFDLAFCLNHLLLKCLWVPRAAPGFLQCFERMVAAYRARVDWEPVDALTGRVASLLPGLLLARVDGKSPVEYLTEDRDKNLVREAATGWLREAPAGLSDLRADWARAVGIDEPGREQPS